MAELETILKAPSDKFRINAATVFLTYPRCTITPEELLEKLTPKNKATIEKYMIVQEFHKDGTPHLHALLEYSKKLDIKKLDHFDIDVEPYHGNYATVKKYPAAVRYLTKSGTPYSNWDYQRYLDTQLKQGNIKVDYTKKNEIAINQGIQELLRQGEIPLDRYPHWKRGLQEYKNDINRPVPAIQFTMKLPVSYNPDTYYEIPIDLTDKTRRHYWYYGTTGTGKTFTAEHQQLRHYTIPKNNDWIGYSGEQLLILNEFKGEMTPTQLIDIMESRQQNVKGSSAKLPEDIVLIITSNYTLRECYKNLNENNDAQLDALERRFAQVEFATTHPSSATGAYFIKLDALKSLKDTEPSKPVKHRKINPEIEMNQANLCAPAPDLTNHKLFI